VAAGCGLHMVGHAVPMLPPMSQEAKVGETLFDVRGETRSPLGASTASKPRWPPA
jgi:hypothetical protein